MSLEKDRFIQLNWDVMVSEAIKNPSVLKTYKFIMDPETFEGISKDVERLQPKAKVVMRQGARVNIITGDL